MRVNLLMEGALDFQIQRRAPRGVRFDFIGGLVDDIGKVAGNVIGGKDPFAGVGGIVDAVGTVIGTVKPASTTTTGTAATGSATVANVGGTSFDVAPLLLLVALGGAYYAFAD